MGKVAPIVVHRRSFASALVLGFFGTVCVLIICGASVAIYGLKIVNDKVDELIAVSPEALNAVTSWQQAMPPAVTDALQDRRMPEYREQIEVHTELVRDWRTERQIPVVEVTNNGDQVISLMSLRLVIQDDELIPVEELSVYAATPLAVESEWRGPLMPGSKRRFRAGHIRADMYDKLTISSEICELRVWDPRSSSELIPSALSTTRGSTPQLVPQIASDPRIEITELALGPVELSQILVEESAVDDPSARDTDAPDGMEALGEVDKDPADAHDAGR